MTRSAKASTYRSSSETAYSTKPEGGYARERDWRGKPRHKHPKPRKGGKWDFEGGTRRSRIPINEELQLRPSKLAEQHGLTNYPDTTDSIPNAPTEDNVVALPDCAQAVLYVLRPEAESF